MSYLTINPVFLFKNFPHPLLIFAGDDGGWWNSQPVSLSLRKVNQWHDDGAS